MVYICDSKIVLVDEVIWRRYLYRSTSFCEEKKNTSNLSSRTNCFQKNEIKLYLNEIETINPNISHNFEMKFIFLPKNTNIFMILTVAFEERCVAPFVERI